MIHKFWDIFLYVYFHVHLYISMISGLVSYWLHLKIIIHFHMIPISVLSDLPYF